MRSLSTYHALSTVRIVSIKECSLCISSSGLHVIYKNHTYIVYTRLYIRIISDISAYYNIMLKWCLVCLAVYIFTHTTPASIQVIHVHHHFWCCKGCCTKTTDWCHWSEWGSVRDKTRTARETVYP